GDSLHVWQRWNVDYRQGGDARFRHGIEQFANPGRAVLRLLHGETIEIVVFRIEATGRAGGDLARQLPGIEDDRVFTAPDRQPDLEAFGVDEVSLGGKAYQMNPVPAEQKLGGQQRPLGGAHHQDVESWQCPAFL